MLLNLLDYPAQAYYYIQYRYGSIGLIFTGILLVMSVLSFLFWLDRRK